MITLQMGDCLPGMAEKKRGAGLGGKAWDGIGVLSSTGVLRCAQNDTLKK